MYKKTARIQTTIHPLAAAVALCSGTMLAGLAQAQDGTSGPVLE
jgi:hypothetical protein